MHEQNRMRDDAEVPGDFDAIWYRSKYPDVGLSNLDAAEHYRKFGLLMGRCPNARALANRQEHARNGAQDALPLPRTLSRRFGAGPLPEVEGTPLSFEKGSPLIAGPAGRYLVEEDRSHFYTPQRLSGLIRIDSLAGHPDADTLLAPVAAYFRLLGTDVPANLVTLTSNEASAPDLARRLSDLARQRPQCGGRMFREGPTQIRDAWFADEGKLRLALAGAEESEAQSGLVLRAFQSLPDDAGRLQQIGAAGLPSTGPFFFDGAVFNPLMPVLLILSSRTDTTLETALLPFPSLLRGGLHAAERAAYQVGSGPMNDMWRLSAALLAEFLGGQEGKVPTAPLAISKLTVDLADATGAERLVSRPVRQWLAAVFGLRPEPEGGDDAPGPARLVTGFSQDKPPLNPLLSDRQTAPGLTLRLAADCLPTLGCLVSRQLSLPEGQEQAAGPFLVAETVTGRPLWSVSLPMPKSRAEHARGLPLIMAGAAPAAEQGQTEPVASGNWLAPLHLAIRLVAPEQANETQTLMPVAPDMPCRAVPEAGIPAPISVVLRARDPVLVRRCLSALSRQDAVRVGDLLICLDAGSGAEDVSAFRVIGEDFYPGQVRILSVPSGATVDLDRAAAKTSQAYLCLIQDDVILYDPAALNQLQTILDTDSTAASVSCALLHEAVAKTTTRVQVAAAGLFPAHVSLITSPRLGVAQPDCLAALPDATYPVLANSFQLSLIRRDAVEQTKSRRISATGFASADLKFGLDAAATGWRNLCTTQVRAGTTALPQPRDEIDPFGLACVLPARWDDLLSSVTVLRQLRG